MDNNNFPPLEPDNSMPELFPEVPERMEPLEDFPEIQELAFEEEPPVTEPEPVSDEPALSEMPAEEPVIEEMTFQEEPIYVEPGAFSEEMIPQEVTETPEEVLAEECIVTPLETLEPQVEEAPVETSLPEEVLLEVPEDLMEPPVDPPSEPLEEAADQEYRDNSQDFETMMKVQVPEPEKPKAPEPFVAPKGRPKRKKGEGLLGIPSILATFVWLALIVIIGVTAGRMLWICAADVLAFGREDKVVTVTVYESDTMEEIIDKLHEGGLIRYKSLFSLYAGISDAEEDIKPGIYDLNTRYDYHALVNFMSPRSSREVIKLTIPEGYTCRQIFALLEENRICTARDAAAYAANGELSEYWFLENIERGAENCLEGYLFPDTYEFYKNSTPREAIERMLDNFEYRFDEELLEQLEDINDKFRADYGVREIVIIASLIEKESAAPGESPMVSGVIYNRLFKWGNNRPLLNIDATIVYAQEGQNQRIDTKLDHPYNTYLYEGLTPGPIANPGLSSLKAALNPESHNYYYYVLNPATGMHQFSTTYEEHSGYVREFAASTPEIEIE